MTDQKNASFLYYLRSFFKQGDSCENGCGTPMNKRKGTKDDSDFRNDSSETHSFDNNTTTPTMVVDDDDDDGLSRSSKRRRSSGC